MSTIYLSIRWSICCPFISLYVVLYSFTPTGGCPTFIKLQSGPKNLTLSSFGVCDWTRFHSSGRVSQPDSLPAPMTYDHRSLHTSGVSKLWTQWTQTSEKDRLCYAMLYAYQTRSEISGFLDTPIGNNIKQLPLNRWPPSLSRSLSRSIQPYSFCGAQPNVAA